MKTPLQELMKVMHDMLNALQKETQPIVGHTDPGAIIDCYAELHECIEELPQQAIAEHEASQWKKYPENKPEDRRIYLVDRYVTSNYIDSDGETFTYREITITRYYETPKVWESNVIAFRELPKPYQEGEKL